MSGGIRFHHNTDDDSLPYTLPTRAKYLHDAVNNAYDVYSSREAAVTLDRRVVSLAAQENNHSNVRVSMIPWTQSNAHMKRIIESHAVCY